MEINAPMPVHILTTATRGLKFEYVNNSLNFTYNKDSYLSNEHPTLLSRGDLYFYFTDDVSDVLRGNIYRYNAVPAESVID